MKKLRAKLAFFLALLMCAPLFASCSDNAVSAEPSGVQQGETTAPAAEEEAVPEETELSDGLPDTNLDGYEFRYYSMLWTDGVHAAHRIMAEDYTGDPVNDALRDSTLYIEERFNCKITVIDGGDAYSMGGNTSNLIVSGDNAFDVAVGHDGTMMGLAKQGMFYNLKNVEQFDFEKPWWLPSMDLELCGKMYLASSYLSFTNLHWTRAIMVNKNIMTELNVEIPYDTVREGTWTLDKMCSLTENTYSDLDGDGRKTEKDRIGLCTGVETLYCLQESLGLGAYTAQADGTRTLDLDLERVDTALGKLRSIFNTDNCIYKTNSAFTSEIFKTGTAMMVLGQIGDAYDIYRDSDFNYGFLPCPKYDELQEKYINGCTDLPWAIPKTVTPEQVDIIGTIVEATSCYNYKNVLPAYFEVAMKSRTADSPDDSEMLQIIADGRTISFGFSYGLTFNDVLRKLIVSNEELASYYQANQKAAQKVLSTLIEDFNTME